MQYIENYGTGIRRMYKAYKDSKEKPDFEVRENSFKVIFPNRNSVADIKRKSDIFVSDSVNNETVILDVLQKANKGMKRKKLKGLLVFHVARLLAD